MRKNKLWMALGLLCMLTQWSACESKENGRAAALLEQAATAAEGNRMIYFGKALQGTPYGANTLEGQEEERLVSRLDSVDCVTFVETVTALSLCDRHKERTGTDFERRLQQVRYRDGKIDGYGSRLHYFTEWIANNEKMGLVEEVTRQTEGAQERVFDLNFMSTHRSAYPALENDEASYAQIRKVETDRKAYPMPYIPKELLNEGPERLAIKDGDILALTTSLAGLDVVHTGIACWIDGKLHLIHASSVKGKVIVDETPLYDYLKNKKRHTGVRVVRLK